MSFSGFSSETGEFLWELAFHNEKPWFEAHREQFLRAVKNPLDDLAHDTRSLMQSRHPEEPYQVHISRIYRDARRLFGRGPYKDHLWFTIWTGAERRNGPDFWFELGPASYSYGLGFYTADSEQMAELRSYMEAHPAAMERLVKSVNKAGYHLEGEMYKRLKKDVGEVLNPWYNRKWIGFSRDFDHGGDLYSDALPTVLADAYDKLMPVYRLFDRFSSEKEKA
jgi:uncharacterized protein (TIGR02453 family)